MNIKLKRSNNIKHSQHWHSSRINKNNQIIYDSTFYLIRSPRLPHQKFTSQSTTRESSEFFMISVQQNFS